jgi:uncharacterized surface protein with fasciclin (FAS1) repeats
MLKFLSTAAAVTLGLAPLAACATMDGDDMASASDADARVSQSIVERAMASPDHGTLVAAVQAAGLVETLSGDGPFTLFAPTNAAFAKLPAGTVASLLQPANRNALQSVLTYHVVAGRVTAGELVGMIEAGGGQARLTTVQGGTLTARMMGGRVVLVDANGGMSTVTAADMMQSNGVIHVTDAVSLPG